MAIGFVVLVVRKLDVFFIQVDGRLQIAPTLKASINDAFAMLQLPYQAMS